VVTALSVLGFTLSVQAHDPKDEMASGDIPDCAAMHKSDGMEMDMNDSVTQAMMKKCMDAMHGSDDTVASGQQKQSEGSTDKPRHQHDKMPGRGP
jgi:hypothetical protein